MQLKPRLGWSACPTKVLHRFGRVWVQGRSVQGGYTNPLRKRLGGDVLYDADTRK
jgi:hypothetical protein